MKAFARAAVFTSFLVVVGHAAAEQAILDAATGVPNFLYIKHSIYKGFGKISEAVKSNDDKRVNAAIEVVQEVLADDDFCSHYPSYIKQNVDAILNDLIRLKRKDQVEKLATAAIETFKTDDRFVAACQDRRKLQPAKTIVSFDKQTASLDSDGAPSVGFFVQSNNKALLILGEMFKANDELKSKSAADALLRIYADPSASNRKNATIIEPSVDEWLKTLTKQKRYELVEKLALASICKFPYDLKYVEIFQERRIRAKLDQGKADVALSLAKSLYNVCSMAKTSHSIDLICECLEAVNKDKDPAGAAKQFKLQQVIGASPPSAKTSDDASAPKGSVLSSIAVDAQEYNSAIATAETDFDGIDGPLGKGNLLLLADKAKEAKSPIDKAYKTATEKDLAVAVESVARAMRAEDGCVGRANAWVMSLRAPNQ